jgi:hypothetical protein
MGATECLQTTHVLKGVQDFEKVWERCRHLTIAKARKLTGTIGGLGDDKGTIFTEYHTLLAFLLFHCTICIHLPWQGEQPFRLLRFRNAYVEAEGIRSFEFFSRMSSGVRVVRGRRGLMRFTRRR